MTAAITASIFFSSESPAPSEAARLRHRTSVTIHAPRTPCFIPHSPCRPDPRDWTGAFSLPPHYNSPRFGEPQPRGLGAPRGPDENPRPQLRQLLHQVSVDRDR